MRFSIADLAGEVIWVTAYLGLGYLFVDRVAEVADILSNSIGFVIAGLVTLGLGVMLTDALRRGARKRTQE